MCPGARATALAEIDKNKKGKDAYLALRIHGDVLSANASTGCLPASHTNLVSEPNEPIMVHHARGKWEDEAIIGMGSAVHARNNK